MADALDTVRAALLASSPNLGIGTRIYPHTIPQDATLPGIVLQVVGNVPEYTLSGSANLDQVMVQAECYATTYGAVKSLAANVRTTLDDAGMILASEVRDFDANLELYFITQDWFVWIAPT